MKKRILSALLCLCMVMALLPTTALAENYGHTGHTCDENCGHIAGDPHKTVLSANWTAWNTADSLPGTAGNYYLTVDVTLTSTWTISNNVTLCLNGHTITKSNSGDAIAVLSNVTFTLTDCGTTGKIIHASGTNGGGVNVSVGTFNMYGGTIRDHQSGSGAGVYMTSGSFTMSGGTICNNKATSTSGGGVHVAGGTFTMSGTASITGNTATSNGGGVFVNGGTFNMSGTASITGNKATSMGGGVYVSSSSNSTMTVSGGVKITGNKKGTEDNNVYLYTTKLITVTGALTGGENSIGVSRESLSASSTTDIIAQGKTESPIYAITADDANCFVSDDTQGETAFLSDSAKVVLRKKHQHSWSYEVVKVTTDGDSIKATCAGCSTTEILTISAPEHAIYGDGKEAAAKLTGGTTVGGVNVSEINIRYYTWDGVDYTGETTTPPTNAGNYKASITVGGAEAFVTYTIDPKLLTDVAIAAIGDQTYTGSAIQPEVSVTSSKTVGGDSLVKDTDYTVAYADNINVGTATVTVTAKAGSNYTFSPAVTKNFTITSAAIPDDVGNAITGYTGTYDGNPHNAVTIGDAAADYTVKYSDAENGTYNADMPQVTNVSDSKTVWVEISQANYTTAKKSVTVTVSPKELTADDLVYTGEAITKEYNGSVNCNLTTVSVKPGVLFGGDTLTVSGTAVYNSANVATATQVTFTPTAITTGNYSLAADQTLSIPASITAADLAVTGSATASGTYGKKLSELSVNASGLTAKLGETLVPGTWAFADDIKDTVPVVDGNTSYALVFTATENPANYKSLTTNVIPTINKAAPTVTAPTAKTLTYTGDDQELVNAGSATGGTMKYKVGEGGDWSNTIPTGRDAGTYEVYYKVVGDSNHNDTAGDAYVPVTINKASLDGQNAAKNIRYNDTAEYIYGTDDFDLQLAGTFSQNGDITDTGSVLNSAPTYGSDIKVQLKSGLSLGDPAQTVTIPVTFTPGDTNYAAKNYTLTITLTPKATQDTLTLNPSATTVTFDQTLTLGTTGGTTGGAVTYSVTNGTGTATIAGNVLTATGVGTVTVTATMAGNNAYSDVTSAPVTITINKADMADITATGYNGAYDGNPHGITVSNVPDGATVKYGTTEGGCTLNSLTYTDFTNGAQTVYYKVSKDNYNDFTGSATVNITKATMAGITATGYDAAYDGTPHGITVSNVPDGATVKYGTTEGSYTLDSSPTHTNFTNGAQTVYYKVSKDNYNDFTGSATVNITKAAPNVTNWPTVSGTVYVNGTASLNSDGTIENSVAGNFVLAQTSWTSAGVQTTTITFNPTDSTNYNAVPKSDFTVTVVKRTVASAAAQTPITSKIYGTVQDDLGLPATVGITTADSKNFTVPVTWTGYNPNTLDAQTLTGTLDLTAIEAEVDQPSTAITAQITVDLQERTAGNYEYQPKTETYTGAPISHEIPALDGVASISYSYVGINGTEYAASATAPTNAGSYQVTATFTMAAGYASVASKTAALTITPAEVVEPTVSGTYTYTGAVQTVTLAGLESCMTITSGNTATNAGDYTVTVTLDDNHQWAAGSDGSVAWSIAKAPVTVAAKDQSIYIGQDVPDLSAPVQDTHYTVTGLFGSDSLDLAGVTMAYGATPDNTAAGTYSITVTGAADASGNYEIAYAEGTLTISARPSVPSGGGDYTPPTYKVESEVTEDTDGSVSFSTDSAKKDDTVTITVTPDRYYKVDGVTVKDSSGNEIAVTDNKDGTFTFQMPASQVTVEPFFSWDNPFTDVAEDAYYAPAVEWALKNNVTNGTGDGTTFSPNADCTRAQIVTFLWRAAGSPEPAGTNSFTDVSADAYYAKAVAWAVEQGITGGTGGGKFSPDAICTRSQGVTFLYRAVGSPEVFDNIAFSDVTAGSYYADAVAWAAQNGVTNGTGNGKFSPGADCTRGQIMTFLYRWMVK